MGHCYLGERRGGVGQGSIILARYVMERGRAVLSFRETGCEGAWHYYLGERRDGTGQGSIILSRDGMELVWEHNS